MDEGYGVVAEKCVGPASEFEVMGDVVAGLGGGEGRHGESEGDSLIERGEHAELDPSAQGWLSDEEAGER